MVTAVVKVTEVVKVLYNDCYGEFDFSEAFLAEYKERTGRTLDIYKALFYKAMRTDPVAIAILEEKGAEWSSGPNSFIALRGIPAVFEKYWEIEETDGDEYVRVDVNAALADVLRTYMETGDEAAMKRQYTTIVNAQKSEPGNGSYFDVNC